MAAGRLRRGAVESDMAEEEELTFMDSSKSQTRREALRTLIVLPALAGAIALGTATADAADNKAQFKYQTMPAKNGAKCSTCRFFKPPHGCSVVTGTISPNGWCIAYAKK
jgi:High potential iron-sulfur protein